VFDSLFLVMALNSIQNLLNGEKHIIVAYIIIIHSYLLVLVSAAYTSFLFWENKSNVVN